jgi:hypothetical protein
MFTTNHFYHRIIRKNVIAFGNLFKNITLLKYNIENTEEFGRQTVPLSYGGKENFVSRLFAEPELAKATQIQLPRMSFEMTSLSYDATRKLSKFNTSTKANPGNANTVSKIYGPVPYNMGFELNLYVRNVEDGTQIIEQILPFFSPDYVITLNYLDGYNIALDVPVTLDTVDYIPEFEGPDTTTRILLWTLTFTMKTFFFASEINSGVGSKIIRKAIANTYTYTSNTSTNTKVSNIVITPDPSTANIDSDYGFTETILTFPDIP